MRANKTMVIKYFMFDGSEKTVVVWWVDGKAVFCLRGFSANKWKTDVSSESCSIEFLVWIFELHSLEWVHWCLRPVLWLSLLKRFLNKEKSSATSCISMNESLRSHVDVRPFSADPAQSACLRRTFQHKTIWLKEFCFSRRDCVWRVTSLVARRKSRINYHLINSD